MTNTFQNDFNTTAPGTAGTTPPVGANGLGIAGFVTSLVGFLTCFCSVVLCPIGLVLSLFGLRHPKKGLAIAGVVIGAIGTLVAIVGVVLNLLGSLPVLTALNNTVTNMQLVSELENAAQRQQTPLTEADVRRVIDGNDDFRGQPLNVTPGDDETLYALPGSDGRFETDDDFRFSIDREGNINPFLLESSTFGLPDDADPAAPPAAP